MIKTYIETRYIKPMSMRNFFVEDLSGQDSTLTVNIYNSDVSNLQYSLDEKNWNNITVENNIGTATVSANSRLYLRAVATAWGTNNLGSTITVNRNFAVGGNILSLLYGSSFDGTQTQFIDTTKSYIFRRLFTGSGKTNLISAENLVLLTANSTGCYGSLFNGCSNLTTPPPTLPANDLKQYCYEGMFESCSRLTYSPLLAATTPVSYAYSNMFQRTGILTVTVAATTWPNNCATTWLYYIPNGGTIYIPAALDGVIPENSYDGIPSGWNKAIVS